MLYTDSAQMRKVATYLADAAMTMNPVAMCVPTNLSEIEKDWKACAKRGYFTDPVFEYDTAELKRIAQLGNKLEEYHTYIRTNCIPENEIDSAILSILGSRIVDATLTSEMAYGILNKDDRHTMGAILRKYGRPSAGISLRCYEIIENPSTYRTGEKSRFDADTLKTLQSLQFNAADMRKRFMEIFKFYGFQTWECVIDSRVQNAVDARDKTESGKSQLVIPARKTADGRKLCSLISHEIESHVRGSENSRALFKQLLGEGSPLSPLINLLAKADDEKLYEGVAKMADVFTNGDTSKPHPYYVIAINQALRGDNYAHFGAVAETIYGLKHNAGITSNQALDFAWNVTRRVYRGCTNTAKPRFANTKDLAYFIGYTLTQCVPTSYLDFSSMSIVDLQVLAQAGVDLNHPAHPNQDAVSFIVGK